MELVFEYKQIRLPCGVYTERGKCVLKDIMGVSLRGAKRRSNLKVKGGPA